MSFPFSSQGLVIEPLDQLETRWTGDPYDVFPFLIAPKHFIWELWQSPNEAAMLKNLPHTNNILYVFGYGQALVGLTSCPSPAGRAGAALAGEQLQFNCQPG